jgi:hypothetical protein
LSLKSLFGVLPHFFGGLYREKLKGADKLWAGMPHIKIRKNDHMYMCPEIFNFRDLAERVNL